MRGKPVTVLQLVFMKDYLAPEEKMESLKPERVVWADVFFWALISVCLVFMAFNW